MTIPVTRSRENTRARLLDAAATVFAEVGLDGASVEDICERAGFTRGAFYSNFDSKDELFLMLAGRVGEARINTVRARVDELAGSGALAEGCDAVALVRDVMDSGDDDRVGVMLLSEIRIRALRDPQLAAAYRAQEQELIDSIAQIITDIVDVGVLTLRMPARDAACMLMILWEGMTVRGVMEGKTDRELRHAGSAGLGQFVQLLLGD